MFGNVWEWVEDQFNGLPGFKTTYLYNDFSSPCFDGRHTMIMVHHDIFAYMYMLSAYVMCCVHMSCAVCICHVLCVHV